MMCHSELFQMLIKGATCTYMVNAWTFNSPLLTLPYNALPPPIFHNHVSESLFTDIYGSESLFIYGSESLPIYGYESLFTYGIDSVLELFISFYNKIYQALFNVLIIQEL